MKKSGKHVENARKKVEARPYKLAEGTELIKKTHHTKFNETVELAVNLGVDPKHSDQVVRGTVVLPHGLGKAVRVLVIASGEKVREATDAGADFVGGEDMVTKKQVEEIAKIKLVDLNTTKLESAVRTVMGTARNMGLDVVEA